MTERNPYHRALLVFALFAFGIGVLMILFTPFLILIVTGEFQPLLLIPPAFVAFFVVFALLADRWGRKNG